MKVGFVSLGCPKNQLDTEVMLHHVAEAGYEITVEPKNVVIPSAEPYPARIAFFIGPLGEEIEVFQRK